MADQHHETNPAMGNDISSDIPDILESIKFHWDVFGNFCTTLSTTSASAIYPAKFGRTAKTSDYTMTAADVYLTLDGTSNTVTLTLLAASSAGSGRVLFVKCLNVTNAVDIDGNGSETIDGQTGFTFTSANEVVKIVCNGTNWEITDHFVNGIRWKSISDSDSPYTVSVHDELIQCDATSGAITATLPAASSAGIGKKLIFKLTNATNALTIDGNGDETIEGSATHIVNTTNDTVEIYCDGSNWRIANAYAANTARIKVGNYTGDGTTSKSITGLGFQPKFVKIWNRPSAAGASDYACQKVDDTWSTLCETIYPYHDTINQYIVNNAIISFDTDGFTVGDGGSDADPNSNSATYTYLAIG